MHTAGKTLSRLLYASMREAFFYGDRKTQRGLPEWIRGAEFEVRESIIREARD